jgi:hypothetical protein
MGKLIRSVAKKHLKVILCAGLVFAMGVCPAFGMEPGGFASEVIDFDYALLLEGQSTTVTADLPSLIAFNVTAVILITSSSAGSRLTMNMVKSDNPDEVIAMVQVGSGSPSFDVTVGVTRALLELDTLVRDFGVILIISSVLSSPLPGPYEYSLLLSY